MYYAPRLSLNARLSSSDGEAEQRRQHTSAQAAINYFERIKAPIALPDIFMLTMP